MIVFLVTSAHSYTLKAIARDKQGIRIDFLAYGRLPEIKALPTATYVFTDLDRLPTELLKLAARLYRRLKEAGQTVLNDPARTLSRSGLLKKLYAAGFNRFTCYRAEDWTVPARWPVFLRSEGDHEPPRPELFHTPDELARGIETALTDRIPVSKLLIVEFMAEETVPGLYRKLGMFRIGPSSFAHTCVHDTHWIAKDGKKGIATQALYDEEFAIVRDNPHGGVLARAFDLGGFDYGRADFGLVGGQVQLYEINSNPAIQFAEDHPFPIRMESYRLFRENFFKALRAVDTPDAEPLAPV